MLGTDQFRPQAAAVSLRFLCLRREMRKILQNTFGGISAFNPAKHALKERELKIPVVSLHDARIRSLDRFATAATVCGLWIEDKMAAGTRTAYVRATGWAENCRRLQVRHAHTALSASDLRLRPGVPPLHYAALRSWPERAGTLLAHPKGDNITNTVQGS